MARTSSQKLPYWQCDVGLFNDMKVVDLNDKYGPLGEVIFFRVLCYIAESNGYFAQINDALILSIYRSIGSKWIKDRKIVSEVIHYCGVCGLFDVNLLTQNVITSPSIQRRWLNAKIKGRAKGYSTAEYWLLDSEEIEENGNEPLHGIPLQDSNSCSNNDEKCSKNSNKCNNNSPYKEREERNKRERSAALPRLSLSQQKFHDAFPKKKIDAEIPDDLDLDAFIEQIKESVFLSECDNLGLLWCLKRREDILAGKYRKFKNKPDHGFAQRDYTEEELNGLFERFRFANEE